MSLAGIGGALGDRLREETWSPERAWDRIEATWPTPEAVWDWVGETIIEPVWGWVKRIVEFSFWVLETLRIVTPIQWYRWLTAADERTCPECAPLHGREWPEDHPHAAPPLHVNCRCRIIAAFVEYQVRFVEEWRLRWDTRVEWDWQRTGTSRRTVYEWEQVGWA